MRTSTQNIEESGFDNDPIDHQEKFEFIHKRWKALYDHNDNGLTMLKEAMKRHLYKIRFGDPDDTMDGFNSLGY